MHNNGPESNRILFVRNIPYKIGAEELYDLFGKYGAIYQIRLPDTRGTAFVVYEDVQDAKYACEHLNNFNFMGRYLVCAYHLVLKVQKTGAQTLEGKREALSQLQQQYQQLQQE